MPKSPSPTPSQRIVPLLLLAGLLLGACAASDAAIILSEVMYKPQVGGVDNEWVELYNTGSSSVNIGGWQFGLPGAGDWTSGLPGSTTLGAGEALILTSNAASFDSDWGSGKNRIQVSNFPLLPNDPSGSGGRIAIRNGSGVIQNEITYANGSGWPNLNGNDGHSMYVLPQHLDSNTDGANWRPSSQGVYGASWRNGNGGENHGSPGFVATQQQAAFEPTSDVMWSMVILPDIQNYTSRNDYHLNILKGQTQWIKDNKNAFNIQVVLQEGDITNTNSNDSWWENAVEGMSTLNGVVPYIMTAGNHDYNTGQTGRNTQFNTYFKATDNPLVDPATGGILKGTMEPNRLENAYFEFTAPDGRNMLIFSLEHWPRDSVLNWAKGVAQQSQYADHTAVLLNHAILSSGGGFWNVGSEYYDMDGGNDGQQIWDKLLKVAPNIEMTFSGHVGGDGVSYRLDQNNAGKDVNMMLLNSQFEANGGNGWLRVLEFLDDGETVRVRTYSPHFDLYRTGSAHTYDISLSPVSLSALVWNDDGSGGSVGISSGFARGDGDQNVGAFPVSPYLAAEKEDLLIGYNGNATLSGSASRTVGSMHIGTNQANAIISGRNGDGTFTASGSTSLTTSDEVRSGDFIVGEGNKTGTVNWDSSGTLDVQGDLRVGQGGDGVLNQNDGVVMGGSTPGSLEFIGIGVGSGSDGQYNLNSGSLLPGGGLTGSEYRHLIVGDDGATGALNVGDGSGGANTATVQTRDDLVIGRDGGTGSMQLSADGRVEMQTTSGNEARLLVGVSGSGTINQSGGVLTSDSLATVGDGAGGDGSYVISGGSLTTASDGDGTFSIGENGATGHLNVSGTASVTHGADLYVGASSGSTGRLELIGSSASMQIGQLANADGATETMYWQADSSGVTPITVTGAGPLGSNRVQLQSTTEAAANTGSGSTLSGYGVALGLNLQAMSGSSTQTLINNQTSDAVTGYFQNPASSSALYAEGAAVLGTGYEGLVNVSYVGGTGNDVVLNLTDAEADSRLIVRLKGDAVSGGNGAAVSSWADAASSDSFNGTVSQGSSSAQPVKRTGVLNGHAVVEFDGVDDVLLSSQNNSLPTKGKGITVFAVATSDQGGAAAERIAQLGRSDGAAGFVVGMDMSSTSTSTSDGGSGFRFNNGRSTYSAGIDDSDFHIVVFQVDHNSLYSDATMFVDGTQSANIFTGSSTNSTGTTSFTGSTLELMLGTGRLGGGGLAPNDYYGGQIAEFLVYNEQMSVEEIDAVADFLSFKYDLPFAFSSLVGGGGGSPVPEPTTAVLMLLAAALIRRKRVAA